VPPSKNNAEEDDESNDSQEGHESVEEENEEEEEEEEEGMVEGTLNPRSGQRNPFDPSPTIHVPHKSLRFVKSYKGKGATKQVKKLRKIDPRSQQRDASDYRFHTQF
jgi:hypothetical protein